VISTQDFLVNLKQAFDSEAYNQAFSFSVEKQRAMHGLNGILAGVSADKLLDQKELLFLDSWLKSQQFLASDPDVIEILSQVADIFSNGLISAKKLGLLEQGINQLIFNNSNQLTAEIAMAEELMGLLSKVAADGVLSDQQMKFLSIWLESNAVVRDVWPAGVIISRLANVMEDGFITEEERKDLLQTVARLTGAEADETGPNQDASTEIWEDDVESVKVLDSTFCLTGDFVSGDRNAVDTMLRCMGAQISSTVNRAVDYLVIGSLASSNWLYTPHGYKLEKALLLKRESTPIVIITERTLLKFIS
jgi:NAD-dependent DNA ligase